MGCTERDGSRDAVVKGEGTRLRLWPIRVVGMNDVQQKKREGLTWCGPAALTAITGAMRSARTSSHGSNGIPWVRALEGSDQVTRTQRSHNLSALLVLGWAAHTEEGPCYVEGDEAPSCVPTWNNHGEVLMNLSVVEWWQAGLEVAAVSRHVFVEFWMLNVAWVAGAVVLGTLLGRWIGRGKGR